ncbi:MAG: NAD(P)/FAD-dependent oxidoreductase [Verrucomicrobiota bacterium]
MSEDNMHVVVMGGGPAGLTAAYKLTKAEKKATVLEKDNVVGGISRTASYKGYHFDIGGHRFFTKAKMVDDLWREVMGDRFLRRSRMSRIYYRKKFFYYPLRAMNALMGLGIWNSFLIFISYMKAMLFPIKPEKTFQDWVCNRFGKRLFNTFFKTYTEKVWGIPCSEITAEWAAQRIKGLSLLSAAINALLKMPTGNKSKVIKTLIDAFDYPPLGPGQMWNEFKGLIEEKGNRVQMESRVDKIYWEPGSVKAVQVVQKDGTSHALQGTDFLSTLPIKELILKLEPTPPADIVEAANQLSYRDFLTVALIIEQDDLFPDNWIYIHDPDVKVGRIQNFKNWSPDMVPEKGMTCLGLEYFCFEEDGLWTMKDEDLVALGRKEIDQLGLAKAEDVQDGTVVRMPKAYPVYDSVYKEALEKVKVFLATLPNLQLIGRNGMHKYNNQDHSMLTAMMAVKNILGENHNLWEVNADQEYHEEVQSEEERQLAETLKTQPHVPEKTN